MYIDVIKRIEKLEDTAKKDSGNSSRPPSTGHKKKTKSLRKKGVHRSGGQPGHEGHNLKQVKNADHTIRHFDAEFSPHACSEDGLLIRQFFELPLPKLEVTEHRIHRRIGLSTIMPSSLAAGIRHPHNTVRVLKHFCFIWTKHKRRHHRQCIEAVLQKPRTFRGLGQGTLAR